MPNLSTLSGRLLDVELGSEDSTVLFTTSRREGAINDGLREFADLTECWTRTAGITVTSTAFQYDLHSTAVIPDQDFVRFAADRAVEFRYFSSNGSTVVTTLTGESLPQHTLRWEDATNPDWQGGDVSSGLQLPEAFFVNPASGALFLGFTPRPSSGISSAVFTATVPYVAYHPSLTASTQVPYSLNGLTRNDLRPYHQAAVHYAAAQLEKLRKNTEASQQQMQLFVSYVRRYLDSVRIKGGNAIRYTRQYLRERSGPRYRGVDPRV